MNTYTLKISYKGALKETFQSNDLNELIEKAKFIKTLKRYKSKSIAVTICEADSVVFGIDHERLNRTTRTIEDVLKEVTERHGISAEDLCKAGRKRFLSEIRAEFYYLCLRECISPKEIALTVNRSRYTVTLMANKYKLWKEIYQKSC